MEKLITFFNEWVASDEGRQSLLKVVTPGYLPKKAVEPLILKRGDNFYHFVVKLKNKYVHIDYVPNLNMMFASYHTPVFEKMFGYVRRSWNKSYSIVHIPEHYEQYIVPLKAWEGIDDGKGFGI
jgi:hypothetical protein